MVVKPLRAALQGTREKPTAQEEKLAKVREAVPQKHRAAFDDLYEEARVTYRLRDERNLLTDNWAMGLLRRALLSAGRRLLEQRAVEHESHLMEASYDEVKALLKKDAGPSASELAARAQYRATHDPFQAPRHLGGEPGKPPPSGWLPKAAARADRAVGAFLSHLMIDPEGSKDGKTVRGLGVVAGIFEGTARIVRGPEDFVHLEKGEILVTSSTSCAFNLVLPLLGAIVTDRGGLLSHTAIVAREYGIPAVVGSRHATQVIHDGAWLRVNGASGEATVLS
jgi:pyruvate,water dikinase